MTTAENRRLNNNDEAPPTSQNTSKGCLQCGSAVIDQSEGVYKELTNGIKKLIIDDLKFQEFVRPNTLCRKCSSGILQVIDCFSTFMVRKDKESFYQETSNCDFCGTNQRLVVDSGQIRLVAAQIPWIDEESRVCCVVCLTILETWLETEKSLRNKIVVDESSCQPEEIVLPNPAPMPVPIETVRQVLPTAKRTRRINKIVSSEKSKRIKISHKSRNESEPEMMIADIVDANDNDENVDANNLDEILEDPFHNIVAADMYSGIKHRRSLSVSSSDRQPPSAPQQKIVSNSAIEVQSDVSSSDDRASTTPKKTPRLVPFKASTITSTPIRDQVPISNPKFIVPDIPMTRIVTPIPMSPPLASQDNNNEESYSDKMKRKYNLKECVVELDYLPGKTLERARTTKARQSKQKQIFDPSQVKKTITRRAITTKSKRTEKPLKVKLTPKKNPKRKRGRKAKKADVDDSGEQLTEEQFDIQSSQDLELPSQAANLNESTFESVFEDQVLGLQMNVDN